MKTDISTPPRKDIPIHQWTDKDGNVLLVKVLNRDGTTHGRFIWPKSGPVSPKNWSREPDCSSGGLFGWPWGLHIGDGKDPDACAEWIVFSAKPENVILVEGGPKSKAVPSDGGDVVPQVVYRGTQAGAMYFTLQGRLAWIQERSVGNSATGYSGSSSSTGDSGSSSATGDSGSSSATGYSGSSSATGYSGSSSATGVRGSSSATGEEHKNNLSNAGCNDLPLEIQAKFANRCMEVERDFAKLNNPENPEGPEWPIPDYCMVSWLQWRLSSKL